MASTLSSSSTDAAVWASYDDNASWEEDESRAKALAFITACRILLRRRPKRFTVSGQELEFEPVRISQEMETARQWVARNPASTNYRVRYADLEDIRDYE
jgi:hypothetical protein